MITLKPGYEDIGTEHDPIPANEPVLLIRGQDAFGAMFARMYALFLRTVLGKHQMAASVEKLAVLMDSWPTKKIPD